MFKSDKKLQVLGFDNYTTKDGRQVEQIIFGDLENCLRYTFRIPRGMPKPKRDELVYVSIEIKDYQGRQYPALSNIE